MRVCHALKAFTGTIHAAKPLQTLEMERVIDASPPTLIYRPDSLLCVVLSGFSSLKCDGSCAALPSWIVSQHMQLQILDACTDMADSLSTLTMECMVIVFTFRVCMQCAVLTFFSTIALPSSKPAGTLRTANSPWCTRAPLQQH